MVLRICSLFIAALFLMTSCATPQAVKGKEAELLDAPSASQEKDAAIKPVEAPPQVKTAEESRRTIRPEQLRVEDDAQDKSIVLNFVNADIETVISAIAGMLDINYILSPGVKGKVTIQSSKKFPLRDLYQVFQNILEVNGLVAVKDGAVYKIVPIETAKQQPTTVQTGKEVKVQLDGSFVTQIVPLEFVKASDVANITRTLLPRGADLIVYEPSNFLIVTAPPSGLLKFMKILDAIDIPSTERESIRTYVYYVENGEAKKLAEILRSIYAEKGAVSRAPVRVTPSPAPGQPGQPQPSPSGQGISGAVDGDITITPYEDINALIVKASARNYLAIAETLKRLDIPTKQVLIEVLIAEVSLTDKTQFGLEWILKGRAGDKNSFLSGFTSSSSTSPGSVSPTISDAGQILNIVTTPATGSAFAAVIRPDKYGVLLNAFASLGKLNVLSSPHILAMDNREAKIEIGDEIPIATGFQQQPSTSTTTGTTSFVAAGQIQYRTTGIILNVTPHISEKNMVKLKIAQEISSLGPSISLAGIDSPSFSKRRAETIGAVQNGHTLIIGGLISEQKSNSKEGLPVLSKIPVLGNLFGVTSEEIRKTELVVMVTPHVVNSIEEADSITREFQNKVKTIKKRLEENKKTLSEGDEQSKVQQKEKEGKVELLPSPLKNENPIGAMPGKKPLPSHDAEQPAAPASQEVVSIQKMTGPVQQPVPQGIENSITADTPTPAETVKELRAETAAPALAPTVVNTSPQAPQEKRTVKANKIGREHGARSNSSSGSNGLNGSSGSSEEAVASAASFTRQLKGPSPKEYAVQFGAFATEKEAQGLKEKLQAQGVDAYVLDNTHHKYFRVRAGAFSRISEAKKTAASLRKKTGVDNFITEVKGNEKRSE